MPSFRAYPISKNHKVAATPSVVIVCDDEQDGLRQAQQLANEDDIELWDGPRFIARLKPLQGKQDWKLKNESSYGVRWTLRTLHEPRTSMRVWALLGFFAVAITGTAITVDMNATAATLHTTRWIFLEDDLVVERLLEPGSTEMPTCQCGAEMKLADGDRPATTHETEIRIFKCPACEHEMRLTVWSGFDGKPWHRHTQQNEYRMTALLDGIKALLRRNEGLSDNLSSTEVRHYAAEILNRLRHGSTVEMLELYLRQLRTSGSRQFQVSPAAQILAERVFVLFHSDAGESDRIIDFSQTRFRR